MSEQIVDQETPAPRGIDRRDALKKAAVAGGVVWAAPMLLSSTAAAAQAACTLKCGPNASVTFDPVSKLNCPANGQKWVEIDYSIAGSTCPCGGASPTIGNVSASITSGNASVKSAGGGSVIIGGPGNGALSDGSYGAALTFTLTCLDRQGRSISRTCTQGFSFTFSPADGPCSQGSNVGAVSKGSVSCGAPTCGRA